MTRCTGCNWDVEDDEIVWSETRNGETLTLCRACDDESDDEALDVFIVFKFD